MDSQDCPHASNFKENPPTLDFLLEHFTRITPNSNIDRTVPRCRLCDLIEAQSRAEEAELDPFTFTNDVAELEGIIKAAEEDSNGNSVSATEIQEMKKDLSEMIKVVDEDIREAWMEYWAIWGPGEGPDLEGFVKEEKKGKVEGENGQSRRVFNIKGRAGQTRRSARGT